MFRTDAIKVFLNQKTHSDLSGRYNHDMEVQVNVAKENGRKIEGEYSGVKWIGYTDDINTWKPFRIPWNAATDPNYVDSELTFDIFKYAEGIGMTGWDWKSCLSRWVAFDFDAIVGHSPKHDKKLTESELTEIKDKVSQVPYVTMRRSTSGSGLHLYVYLDPAVPTATHTEHAALARSILGLISKDSGLDLHAKVDACGQNMWVWHRKMHGTNGLTVIKSGEPLRIIPVNWKDHLQVISGKRKRTMPQFVATTEEDTFAALTGQRNRTTLDQVHQKIIAYLNDSGYTTWWDADHNMLVTHTNALKLCHAALQLRGLFETTSPATETEHNCFCFPMPNGVWVVRRYTPGTAEAVTWDQDRNGWTRCYYNRVSDLKTVVQFNSGGENSRGDFVFERADRGAAALANLGVVLDMPPAALTRELTLKEGNSGRIIAQVGASTLDNSDAMPGWVREKKYWTKVLTPQLPAHNESEIGNYDDIVRHIVTNAGDDCGWVIKTSNDDNWRTEPLNHISLALGKLEFQRDEIKAIQGSSILNCWKLVNKPFEPEYPGNREWNRNAPQLAFEPTIERDNLRHPTWTSILEHCGRGLNNDINDNKWCSDNGITSGGEYLKCWVASIIQKPTEPLPYLFFFSKEQNTGKSTFHEAIQLILTHGSVIRADAALGDTQFNGELAGAVVCVIEETDLQKSKTAYNKVKDWVTSRHISIRKMYEPPYLAVNTTHWIQCANDPRALKMFPGDTRITMISVPPLETMVPKSQLTQQLLKEAPDFLASLLMLEIPAPVERLAIPTINTSDKIDAEDANKTPLEVFIEECCHYVPGNMVTLAEFFDKFVLWAQPIVASSYTKQRISRDIDKSRFPKGRDPRNASHCIGNISFKEGSPDGPRLILKGDKLVFDGAPSGHMAKLITPKEVVSQ